MKAGHGWNWLATKSKGKFAQAKVLEPRNRHQRGELRALGRRFLKNSPDLFGFTPEYRPFPMRSEPFSDPQRAGPADECTDICPTRQMLPAFCHNSLSVDKRRRGPTPRACGWRPMQIGTKKKNRSGQGRARTADTGLFRAVLYQLSYLTLSIGDIVLLKIEN